MPTCNVHNIYLLYTIQHIFMHISITTRFRQNITLIIQINLALPNTHNPEVSEHNKNNYKYVIVFAHALPRTAATKTLVCIIIHLVHPDLCLSGDYTKKWESIHTFTLSRNSENMQTAHVLSLTPSSQKQTNNCRTYYKCKIVRTTI